MTTIQYDVQKEMAKMKFLLTAFSKDRPGIVADISQVIFENGYNLEDSSMTYLADEFAILLLLSAPASANENEVLEKLSTECRRLERDKNITAYVRRASGDSTSPSKNGNIKTISVEGLDQAGIVYKVSRYLADHNINIRTLKSKVRQSPQSGGALYSMKIETDIPTELSLQQVEDGLDSIGNSLNVDITLN